MTNENFPPQMIRSIKALNSELNREIIVLLVDHGEHDEDELLNNLNCTPEELNKALKELQNGAIIKSVDYIEENTWTKGYKMTDFGHKFLDKLFEAIDPRN